MYTYNSSRDFAYRKPTHEIIKTTNVPTKIHLRPNKSDNTPTGMTVDATSTPMKKQAPIKPILYLLSQSM